MSKHSRFEKLEGEREGGGFEGQTSASLERFAAEPEMAERVAPADAMAPELGAERLQRFDSDGADGLGLDRDPLAELPMLECVGCQRACGKFETVCHACGESLTSPSARAHNLARLEALVSERERAVVANREKIRAELEEAEERAVRQREAQEGMARELGLKFSGKPEPSGAARAWWLGVVCFTGLGLLSTRFGFRLVFFSFGTLCLLTRVPRSVWPRLAERATRGRFW